MEAGKLTKGQKIKIRLQNPMCKTRIGFFFVIFSHFPSLFTAPRLTFILLFAIIFGDLWVEKAYASAAHNRKLRRMAN